MYLYLLRFKQGFFKIGITRNLNRIYKLTKVYEEFEPLLIDSYIILYNSYKTIRALEILLHDQFREYIYNFQGEKYEGYTELFNDTCFENVLNFIHTFSKNLPQSELKIERGVVFKKQKKKTPTKKKLCTGIDQSLKETILNTFKEYKNGISLDISKEHEEPFKVKFTFENMIMNCDIKEQFPPIIYSFEDETGRGGFNLLPSAIIYNEKKVEIIFYIITLVIKYPDAMAFYRDVFEVLELDTSVLDDIYNEYYLKANSGDFLNKWI